MNIDKLSTTELRALKSKIDALLPLKRREAMADLRSKMSAEARMRGFDLMEIIGKRKSGRPRKAA